jgi:hypothetical protein
MMTRIARVLTVTAVGLVAIACQDLDVVNYNAPDRFRALGDPNDVETLIYSAYRLWWTSAHHNQPNRALSVMGNETTSALTGSAVYDVAREPREMIPNTQTYPGWWVMRRPWDQRWQVISNAIDGLRAIEEGGLRIKERVGDELVDVTIRAQAFAHFLAGLGHTYLAYHFDQSYIYTPDMELAEDLDFRDLGKAGFDFHPYDEVAAVGRELLEKSIEMMAQSPRPIPAHWTNSVELSAEDFARIAHSFIARSLVYTPRSPEERAAVDWNQVLYHLDNGIQQDLWARYEENVWIASYKLYTQFLNDARASNRLVGPADTSGAYQDWLAAPVNERTRFRVETPDRRITGPTSTSNGSYFAYRSSSLSNAATRGQYLNSYYTSHRFGGQDGVRENGILVTMPVLEMEFIRAEAYYRLGRKEEAAEIINRTRTAPRIINGVEYPGLPPVTADGVPPSPDCVPRKPYRLPDGTVPCGDLWDALMYEKRIELHGIEALIPYADARGWGQLVEGTPLHFPVPARELEIIGYPEYSFGGVGRPGSAPPPTTVSP